jgi:hypothetical protein
MTDEEMIQMLREYGRKRYPSAETVRDSELDGITFKEFIESLSYGDQKRDRSIPA